MYHSAAKNTFTVSSPGKLFLGKSLPAYNTNGANLHFTVKTSIKYRFHPTEATARRNCDQRSPQYCTYRTSF